MYLTLAAMLIVQLASAGRITKLYEAATNGEGRRRSQSMSPLTLLQAPEYVTTDAINNVCSLGSEPIDDAPSCEAAADALGFSYLGSHLRSSEPSGCVLRLGRVWHNRHAGRGSSSYELICRQTPEYVISSAGSNVCTRGSQPITDVASCRAAAEALSLRWTSMSDWTWPDYPHGCCKYAGETVRQRVWYNSHVGNGDARYELICKHAPEYIISSLNPNVCVQGYQSIADASSCNAAADTLGLSYIGSGSSYLVPDGCQRNPGASAHSVSQLIWFNTNVGSENFDAGRTGGVICKQATTAHVLSITGPNQGATGKYFFFSRDEWSAVFGAPPPAVLLFGSTHSVEQFRDGVKIWEGYVKVWDNHHGIHGRRNINPAPGQWQINNVIRKATTHGEGHEEGEGTRTPPVQASFARVGRGYCAYYDHYDPDYHAPKSTDSLTDCMKQCADSDHCHAINWQHGSFCRLLNQTFTETDERRMNHLRGPECWNKQATAYRPLLRWDGGGIENVRDAQGFLISRNATCHFSGRFPDIRLWGCNGTCGSNWGHLTKCKSLCDHIASCTHITYFSDGGCGIYSECSSTVVNPVEGVSASTYYKVKKKGDGELDKFDRVRVVEDVTVIARNRWTQVGEHSFQLFQEDMGTVNSVNNTGQVSVILDNDVEKEVLVNHTYLVEDDPPLKVVDNDAPIEGALKNFPRAEDMAAFKCPITKKIFTVPVVASDGRTYEQSALQEASNNSETFVKNYKIDSLLNALIEKVVAPRKEELRILLSTGASYKDVQEHLFKILDKNPPSLGGGEVADFRCPISADFFRDPVVASDGHTYEREQIKEVLRRNPISPITRELLSFDLVPNRAMKFLLSVLIQKADLIPKADYVQEVSGK